MIWLFLVTTLVLGIYIIKSRDDYRKQERIQRGSVDALIGAIGGSNERDKIVKSYFKNIENNLNAADCETILKNMCIATGTRPEFDKAGFIDDKTVAILINKFAVYASDMNNSLKDQ